MAIVKPWTPPIHLWQVPDKQDASSIVASVNDLGCVRMVHDSTGRQRVEICAYAAGALVSGHVYQLTNGASYLYQPTATASLDACTGNSVTTLWGTVILVIPQATISAAGYYWFAMQGWAQVVVDAGAVVAGDMVNLLQSTTVARDSATLYSEAADRVATVSDFGYCPTAIDANGTGLVYLFGDMTATLAA